MISIHFNSLAKFIIKGMVKKNRVGYKNPIVHTHTDCASGEDHQHRFTPTKYFKKSRSFYAVDNALAGTNRLAEIKVTTLVRLAWQS